MQWLFWLQSSLYVRTICTKRFALTYSWTGGHHMEWNNVNISCRSTVTLTGETNLMKPHKLISQHSAIKELPHVIKKQGQLQYMKPVVMKPTLCDKFFLYCLFNLCIFSTSYKGMFSTVRKILDMSSKICVKGPRFLNRGI